jgi:hypothetical protein
MPASHVIGPLERSRVRVATPGPAREIVGDRPPGLYSGGAWSTSRHIGHAFGFRAQILSSVHIFWHLLEGPQHDAFSDCLGKKDRLAQHESSIHDAHRHTSRMGRGLLRACRARLISNARIAAGERAIPQANPRTILGYAKARFE